MVDIDFFFSEGLSDVDSDALVAGWYRFDVEGLLLVDLFKFDCLPVDQIIFFLLTNVQLYCLGIALVVMPAVEHNSSDLGVRLLHIFQTDSQVLGHP